MRRVQVPGALQPFFASTRLGLALPQLRDACLQVDLLLLALCQLLPRLATGLCRSAHQALDLTLDRDQIAAKHLDGGQSCYPRFAFYWTDGGPRFLERFFDEGLCLRAALTRGEPPEGDS